MKKRFSHIVGKAAALAISASMLLGIISPFTVLASDANGQSESDLDKNADGVINYVAIGSYDAMGFGLDGYAADAFGYNKATDGSYADLFKEKLESSGKQVQLTQLGIEGMRAEELRYLLDSGYRGDAYTAANFLGAEGVFEKLGGDGALRQNYADAIKAAEVITIDIGFDNFATYALSYIFENEYEADFTIFDEGMQRSINEIKGRFEDVLGGYVEDADADEVGDLLDRVIDGLAYALVGYCHNLDMSLGEIYSMNPDVAIVVTDVRNPVCGLTATMDGLDFSMSLELIYGVLVDLANVYVGSLSAYDGAYYFAYLGSAGANLDEIENYSGDPLSVSADLAARAEAMLGNKLNGCTEAQRLAARDAVLELSKLATTYQKLDLTAAAIGSGAFDKIEQLISAAVANPSLDITASADFKAIKADASAMSHLAAYARYKLAAFALLNAQEHAKMAEKIYNAVTNGVQGRDVIKGEMNEVYSFLSDFFGRETLLELEYTFKPYYTCDGNSYYVALGDGSAEGEGGYPSKLADKFAAGFGFDKAKSFKNYANKYKPTDASAQRNETPDLTLAAIMSGGDIVGDIVKADLITLSYTNVETTKYMLGSKTPNWNELPLLGETLAPIAQEIVGMLRAELAKSGLSTSIADIAGMVEKYAYSYISRAVNYVMLVETIHEINPNALVVIVGTYNDMEGFEITINGESLPIGNYVQYLIDAANLETLCYAMLSDKTAYISAPDVETVFETESGAGKTWDIGSFVFSFLRNVLNRGQLLPSDAGHEYIADIVVNTVEVVPAHDCIYDNDCDNRCDICKEKRAVSGHAYSAECDKECNNCGALRIAAHHSYDADCDTSCNNCGDTRDAAAHLYSADCDAECNRCGESRQLKADHSFGEWKKEDGQKVRVCSACGHTESEEAGLSGGVIAIIAVVSVAVLGGCGFVAYKFGFKKKTAVKSSDNSSEK